VEELGGLFTAAAAPSFKYFVVVNNASSGPFGYEDLKRMTQDGRLSKSTLVWKEGMAQWTAAGSVDELAAMFQ
jgi:hypothetical protein